VAVVEYDGTNYNGFQRQRHHPSIQDELERALARVTQEKTPIVGAGRTDSGVHARGQVISCSTCWSKPLAELERALNAVLPAAIAVRELREAAPGFHARYSAQSRTYRYTIHNASTRSPLVARYAHHVPQPLDVNAMHDAAQALVGTHDFASFGRPPQGESTVREVKRAACWREGDRVYVEVEANAFLTGMMRRLVGMLIQVGLGATSRRDVERILKAKDPRTVKGKAPAHGLCLMNVKY